MIRKRISGLTQLQKLAQEVKIAQNHTEKPIIPFPTDVGTQQEQTLQKYIFMLSVKYDVV